MCYKNFVTGYLSYFYFLILFILFSININKRLVLYTFSKSTASSILQLNLQTQHNNLIELHIRTLFQINNKNEKPTHNRSSTTQYSVKKPISIIRQV